MIIRRHRCQLYVVTSSPGDSPPSRKIGVRTTFVDVNLIKTLTQDFLRVQCTQLWTLKLSMRYETRALTIETYNLQTEKLSNQSQRAVT